MKGFILTLIVGLLVSCSQGQNPGEGSTSFLDLNAAEFSEKINSTPGIILDVRTKDEVARGRIKNAINIDFYASNFEEQATKLDRSSPIFVYCAAGGRSKQAQDVLKQLGFKQVYNLKGGFGAWKRKGHEIVK